MFAWMRRWLRWWLGIEAERQEFNGWVTQAMNRCLVDIEPLGIHLNATDRHLAELEEHLASVGLPLGGAASVGAVTQLISATQETDQRVTALEGAVKVVYQKVAPKPKPRRVRKRR